MHRWALSEVSNIPKEGTMTKVWRWLDIAKRVFDAYGADTTGRAVFSRHIRRGKLLAFFAAQTRCLVTL
jgi:hypothetical protein